jgi:hypothetical protein
VRGTYVKAKGPAETSCPSELGWLGLAFRIALFHTHRLTFDVRGGPNRSCTNPGLTSLAPPASLCYNMPVYRNQPNSIARYNNLDNVRLQRVSTDWR